MKKLQREQLKKVMGGLASTASFCSEGNSCSYYEAHTGMVTGHCEMNSNDACVCHAENSSVLWKACDTESGETEA